MSKTNRFKTVSNNIKVKHNLNKFMLKNSDQSIAVDKIVSVAHKYGIIMTSDLDQYVSGYMSKRRLLVVSLFKLGAVLTTFRYFFASVFNKKWVIILMSDANNVLGNQRLFSILVSLAGFIVVSVAVIIQIQEMSHSLTILDFLNDYKHKRILQLNALNTRRLAVRTNLMSKYFIRQAFWPLVLSVSSLFCFAAIVVYLDPESGFSLTSVIFWLLLFFVFLLQLFSLLSMGFVCCTLSMLYLKYKFKEIHENIESSLKFRNRLLLMKAIKEHNTNAEKTKELNEFFSLIIFNLYFFATPPLMIMIYLIHAKDSAGFTRIVVSFVFVIALMVVFSVNLLSSLVSKSAHKPRPL